MTPSGEALPVSWLQGRHLDDNRSWLQGRLGRGCFMAGDLNKIDMLKMMASPEGSQKRQTWLEQMAHPCDPLISPYH